MGNIVIAQGGIPIQQGVYEESSTQKAELGRLLPFADGRYFRYCKAGGAITRGHMCSAAALNGNTDKVTQAGMPGYAIGKKVIKVLLSAAVAAHLFDDGLLTIEDGIGEGYCYRIKSNKAGGAAIATPCELTLYDPLVVALDATSIISLTVNKYQDVVVTPQAEAAPAIGVPLIDITDDYYFWAQTRGYAALYVGAGETATAGNRVGISAATDGAVDEAPGITEKPWGVSIQPAAASTWATIDLDLE